MTITIYIGFNVSMCLLNIRLLLPVLLKSAHGLSLFLIILSEWEGNAFLMTSILILLGLSLLFPNSLYMNTWKMAKKGDESTNKTTIQWYNLFIYSTFYTICDTRPIIPKKTYLEEISHEIICLLWIRTRYLIQRKLLPDCIDQTYFSDVEAASVCNKISFWILYKMQ